MQNTDVIVVYINADGHAEFKEVSGSTSNGVVNEITRVKVGER